MNTGAIVIGALGAACTRSTATTGWSAGDQTATFSFNLAPIAHVLTVTRPDGSVVRHVTIEDGVVGQASATDPNVGQRRPGHRLDRHRQRSTLAGFAASGS